MRATPDLHERAVTTWRTIVEWSPVATTLGPDRFIAGANMAFPRALLTDLGGFRADLGRVGTRLLSNEEIAVEQAIRRRGLSCWYEPRAVVSHHVTHERLCRAFFLRRYWWQGVSDAILETGEGAWSAKRRWRRAGACGLAGVAAAGKALRMRPARFAWACEAVREFGHAGTLMIARGHRSPARIRSGSVGLPPSG